MKINTVGNFTASDLKQSGPVLDAATHGVVRIEHRGKAFLLLRETQFDRLMQEATCQEPNNLAKLLVDYDADDVKKRLSGWNADGPAGREAL
jgi:hypothetical protein